MTFPQPHPGNKFNNKQVKFPEECLRAYDSYCEWISEGNSQESWVYNNNGFSLTHKSMEKYMKEDPSNFPSTKKDEAVAKSLKVWENRGIDMMIGKIEKCQPAIYQMFMRNKFKWDRPDQYQTAPNETKVEQFLDKLDQVELPEEK